jgi:phage gp46-like protein
VSFEDLTGRRSFTTSGYPVLTATPGAGVDQVTHFDGSGAWIQSVGNLSDFPFRTGDFCVEIAARTERFNVVLVDFFRSAQSGWQLWVPSSGLVQWWRGDASYLNGSSVPLGEFCIFAADRRGGVLRLLVNGAVVAEVADTFDYSYEVEAFALGAQVAQRNPTYDLLGDIAWSRVTRASRYVSAYTPSLPIAGGGDPLWDQTVMLFVSGNVGGGTAEPSFPQFAYSSVGDIKTVFFNTAEAADYAVGGLLLAADEGLTTAVILSLFTDARAQVDDAIPHGDSDRRGWWGDAFPAVAGDSLGSRLWLVWPGKQTLDNLLRARGFAEEALQWMVTDGVARAVTVTASNPRDGLLALAITIDKPDGEALALRFESLWSL